MSRLIFVPLLVLCIVAVGQCGSPVACSSKNKDTQYKDGKTAGDSDWHYETAIAFPPDPYDIPAKEVKCRERCEDVCIKEQEGGIYFYKWPGCKAFSSYANRKGAGCNCWGWDTEPEWYDDSGYRSGVCVSQ
ncbi:hypothetical protein ACROYT_G019612 [Oculina patagonica]